jgi:hypothetical protein
MLDGDRVKNPGWLWDAGTCCWRPLGGSLLGRSRAWYVGGIVLAFVIGAAAYLAYQPS